MNFTTNTAAAMTSVDILEGIEKVRAVFETQRRDELAEWMTEKGFPPCDSVLFLPPDQFKAFGPFPPEYLRSSTYVNSPTLVKRGLMP